MWVYIGYYIERIWIMDSGYWKMMVQKNIYKKYSKYDVVLVGLVSD